MTSKKFSNYLGRKIRFSFNGYGNRIVTDDRSLPEAMMMVVLKLGKNTKRCQG
jgi:hypothetical protein